VRNVGKGGGQPAGAGVERKFFHPSNGISFVAVIGQSYQEIGSHSRRPCRQQCFGEIMESGQDLGRLGAQLFHPGAIDLIGSLLGHSKVLSNFCKRHRRTEYRRSRARLPYARAPAVRGDALATPWISGYSLTRREFRYRLRAAAAAVAVN